MKLSKREKILLILLLIIALSFLEYVLVLKPGMDKYYDLSSKEEELQAEIDNINLNLTLAQTMKIKLDSNLVEIETLSTPYLGGVKPDSLLVFTHNMMVKHGFSPLAYSPSAQIISLLQPDQAEFVEMTYQIKEIARQYQSLENVSPTDPADEEPGGENTDSSDIIECYTLQINATGTFDQIKALFDDYDSLERTILVTNLNMTPAVGPENLLNIQFWLSYYGIEKLQPTDEPLNQWTQADMIPNTSNPYIISVTPPTEITEPTTETTAAP